MTPVLLVIAHGSRDPRHAVTVHALCERVRASRSGLRVEVGFLDYCTPRVPKVIERLAAEGVREIVALPLLLTRAFHAKTDIPAVLRESAARHVGVMVRQADVLGPSALLTAAMERRLAEAGVHGSQPGSTGLVLASAGSSDPEARTLIAGIAREWQRSAGWAAVRPADPSSTSDAVAALRAAGVRRVAVVPYVLAPGVLPDRIARGAAGADALASVLGDAPEVARLVLRRYAACTDSFSEVRQVA
jgi:sirohydrochlorin ferrochelatase